MTVPCGDTIVTKAVAYDSAALPSDPAAASPRPGGSTLEPHPHPHADPLAGNTGVATATSASDDVAGERRPAPVGDRRAATINFAFTRRHDQRR